MLSHRFFRVVRWLRNRISCDSLMHPITTSAPQNEKIRKKCIFLLVFCCCCFFLTFLNYKNEVLLASWLTDVLNHNLSSENMSKKVQSELCIARRSACFSKTLPAMATFSRSGTPPHLTRDFDLNCRNWEENERRRRKSEKVEVLFWRARPVGIKTTQLGPVSDKSRNFSGLFRVP